MCGLNLQSDGVAYCYRDTVTSGLISGKIVSGAYLKNGVWIHIGVTVLHTVYGGNCDLDLWHKFLKFCIHRIDWIIKTIKTIFLISQ